MAFSDSFTVLLVRHGETGLNKIGRVQTFTDEPLNETGLEQATLLGKYLGNEVFQAAYTSDLIRASTTAQYVLQHSKQSSPSLTLDPRVRERSFPAEVEGQDTKVWFGKAQAWALANKSTPLKFDFPGGETYEEVVERALTFLKEISDRDGNPGSQILVASHGLWIMSLLTYLKDHQELFNVEFNIAGGGQAFRAPLRNTAITKMRIFPNAENKMGRIEIFQYNDVAHLDVQTNLSQG